MTLEGKLGLLGSGPEAEIQSPLRDSGHRRLIKVRETWSLGAGACGPDTGFGREGLWDEPTVVSPSLFSFWRT